MCVPELTSKPFVSLDKSCDELFEKKLPIRFEEFVHFDGTKSVIRSNNGLSKLVTFRGKDCSDLQIPIHLDFLLGRLKLKEHRENYIDNVVLDFKAYGPLKQCSSDSEPTLLIEKEKLETTIFI